MVIGKCVVNDNEIVGTLEIVKFSGNPKENSVCYGGLIAVLDEKFRDLHLSNSAKILEKPPGPRSRDPGAAPTASD